MPARKKSSLAPVSWWRKLSPAAQKAYIKAHPNSKYAKSGAKRSVSDKGWTASVDRQSKSLFRTFSDAEIRKRQDIADQEAQRAYTSGDITSLESIQSKRAALDREMLRRSTPKARKKR